MGVLARPRAHLVRGGAACARGAPGWPVHRRLQMAALHKGLRSNWTRRQWRNINRRAALRLLAPGAVLRVRYRSRKTLAGGGLGTSWRTIKVLRGGSAAKRLGAGVVGAWLRGLTAYAACFACVRLHTI